MNTYYILYVYTYIYIYKKKHIQNIQETNQKKKREKKEESFQSRYANNISVVWYATTGTIKFSFSFFFNF